MRVTELIYEPQESFVQVISFIPPKVKTDGEQIKVKVTDLDGQLQGIKNVCKLQIGSLIVNPKVEIFHQSIVKILIYQLPLKLLFHG